METNLIITRSQVQRDVAENNQQIINYQNLLRDYKSLAAGNFSRSEILKEIEDLQNDNIQLLSYL